MELSSSDVMKKTFSTIISLFVCLSHTTGLCFAKFGVVSHSPQILETKNWQLETDVGSPLWKGGGGNAAGGLSLTYDALGQVAKVAQTVCAPSGEFLSAFSYDALGNRIVMENKLFIPNHSDALKRPVIECNELGEIVRYYIWGDNRLLGFIDSNGTLTVAHSDDFGSVIALTDLSGNVLYSANYGPHGEDWGASGNNPTPFTWLGGYGVQTLNTDTPLKLYLTRHRVYSATLNRFLSSDPMGLAGGANLYAYGEGNPMAYIDPLGLCASGGGFWSGVGQSVWGGISTAADATWYGLNVAASATWHGLNVAWDYAADPIGKIWNLPNTAIGLAWGALGYGVTALSYGVSGLSHVANTLAFGHLGTIGTLDFPKLSFDNNAIQFQNHPLMLSAITLGNTISYGNGFTPENSGLHEYQHTIQGQGLGLLYLPANILGGTAATILNGYWHGPINLMETGPQSIPPVPWALRKSP